MMKKIIFTIFALVMVLAAKAQLVDPVHFTSELKTGKGAEAEIVFHATIDDGWHVYSTEIGKSGPIEATFHVVKLEGAELVGKLKPKGQPIKKMDKLFDMELKYFEHEATFVQKIRFTKPEYTIDCYLEYGACSEKSCLPPSEVELKQQGKSPDLRSESNSRSEESNSRSESNSGSEESGVRSEASAADTVRADSAAVVQTALSDTDLWAPVTEELRAMGVGEDLAKQSLIWLLLMGFVAGLLAVCMPCIWPIIPMTVSFFLKRSRDNQRKGIRDAFTYGLSIIVIYLGLGLLVTALFGSDTLNAMSTNAVFNVFLLSTRKPRRRADW